MDSGLSPPTRYAPDLVHEGEEGTTGWYGWEEAKPWGERELILKCSATKGCPSHSLPMPHAVETQAPPNFDAPAKSVGQWSPTLNLKVWSWVKGTPPTQKLGEIEDSLLSALSRGANEQKLCWALKEVLTFPSQAPPVHTRALYYTGLLYPKSLRPHQSYQKETSRVQWSKSSQIAKGGL